MPMADGAPIAWCCTCEANGRRPFGLPQRSPGVRSGLVHSYKVRFHSFQLAAEATSSAQCKPASLTASAANGWLLLPYRIILFCIVGYTGSEGTSVVDTHTQGALRILVGPAGFEPATKGL